MCVITINQHYRLTDKQTDEQMTYDSNTTLCTYVLCAVINSCATTYLLVENQ